MTSTDLHDQLLIETQADQHVVILECLARLSWSVNFDTKQASLNIGGGFCGEINPHGARTVVAAFVETDPRWMVLVLGWKEVHEQRIAHFPTARAFAEGMHQAALAIPSDAEQAL
ncbi:hypothetical protein ACYCFK_09460 [Stutzerimonas stutzeri]